MRKPDGGCQKSIFANTKQMTEGWSMQFQPIVIDTILEWLAILIIPAVAIGVAIGFSGPWPGGRIARQVTRQFLERTSFFSASEHFDDSVQKMESVTAQADHSVSELRRASDEFAFLLAEVPEKKDVAREIISELKRAMDRADEKIAALNEQIDAPKSARQPASLLDATRQHNQELKNFLESEEGQDELKRLSRLEIVLEAQIEASILDFAKSPEKLDQDFKDLSFFSRQMDKIRNFGKGPRLKGAIDKIKNVVNSYLKNKVKNFGGEADE